MLRSRVLLRSSLAIYVHWRMGHGKNRVANRSNRASRPCGAHPRSALLNGRTRRRPHQRIISRPTMADNGVRNQSQTQMSLLPTVALPHHTTPPPSSSLNSYDVRPPFNSVPVSYLLCTGVVSPQSSVRFLFHRHRRHN